MPRFRTSSLTNWSKLTKASVTPPKTALVPRPTAMPTAGVATPAVGGAATAPAVAPATNEAPIAGRFDPMLCANIGNIMSIGLVTISFAASKNPWFLAPYSCISGLTYRLCVFRLLLAIISAALAGSAAPIAAPYPTTPDCKELRPDWPCSMSCST